MKALSAIRGIALFFLTWALDRVVAILAGMIPYPLYRRLGEPQEHSDRVGKISPPPGFDSLTLQPVASRYTYYATPTSSP